MSYHQIVTNNTVFVENIMKNPDTSMIVILMYYSANKYDYE